MENTNKYYYSCKDYTVQGHSQIDRWDYDLSAVTHLRCDVFQSRIPYFISSFNNESALTSLKLIFQEFGVGFCSQMTLHDILKRWFFWFFLNFNVDFLRNPSPNRTLIHNTLTGNYLRQNTRRIQIHNSSQI